MPDIRLAALTAVTTVLLAGTLYSVANSTFLDTSNPLLAQLPHPLETTHNFARKSSVLNQIFIKKFWAWTTGAFLFTFFTGPTPARTGERIVKYLAASLSWYLFTSWFFGPPLIQRVVLASGGECLLPIVGSDPISVPQHFCETRTPLSPLTHPTLFAALPLELQASIASGGSPRLARGHDISGHIFILTLAILFLADQFRPSFRPQAQQVGWSAIHKLALAAQFAIIAIGIFACGTTAVYFHTPFEKLSGYIVGVAAFTFTQFVAHALVAPAPRVQTAKAHQS